MTDYATSESCVLNIKVVDNYEALQLLPADYLGEEGITTPQPLQGVDFIFLINTPSREAYFFERGEQTAFSSGLKLLVKGTYELAQEADEKVSLAFVLPEKKGMPTPNAIHTPCDAMHTAFTDSTKIWH